MAMMMMMRTRRRMIVKLMMYGTSAVFQRIQETEFDISKDNIPLKYLAKSDKEIKHQGVPTVFCLQWFCSRHGLGRTQIVGLFSVQLSKKLLKIVAGA